MCGILTVISRPGVFVESQIATALNTLSHRGPDGSGIYRKVLDTGWEVWLGHRRLAIVDLSSDGHQPMVRRHPKDRSSNVAVVFNGEIYNHKLLRRELAESWDFTSQSDTEVLLAGIINVGEQFASEMNSMMAFAALDEASKKITIGRDRLGKKPLYIFQSPELIIVSSELKAIKALKCNLSIDALSLAYYRWIGYVPGQMSIYSDCRKFPAASTASLDLNREFLVMTQPRLFWDPLRGYGKTYRGSYQDAIQELKNLLDDATAIRMEADVPVGIFLSGGIDSSLIAASASKKSHFSIPSFSVKMNNKEFDESDIAADTAVQLGLRLDILRLESEDFAKQVKLIPYYYDEPFSDSSQVPSMAIAELARKHVTVILTGDGGDETFLGYPRYSHQSYLSAFQKFASHVPYLDRITHLFFRTPIGKRFVPIFLSATGVGSGKANLDSKIARIEALLSIKSSDKIYETVMCIQQKSWLPDESRKMLAAHSLESDIRSWYPGYSWEYLNGRSFQENAAALDLVLYLRDDVLVKVDRATMAFGLEARAPLLDYRIVEFGQSLPIHFKIQKGIHKRILRDVLATRVSGKVTKLGKKGFGVELPSNLPEARTPSAGWTKLMENEWVNAIRLSENNR